MIVYAFFNERIKYLIFGYFTIMLGFTYTNSIYYKNVLQINNIQCRDGNGQLRLRPLQQNSKYTRHLSNLIVGLSVRLLEKYK